jgi:hypothetical protein
MTSLTTATTSDVDAEIERLFETIPEFQGRVFVGKVPDGEDIPTNERGMVAPYAVLIFGGLIQTRTGNRGVVGSRANLKHHPFTVMVTGATDRQARFLCDRVRDTIEGVEPLGQGQVSEDTSGNTAYPGNSTLKPTRYSYMMTFSLLIGA